MSAEGKGFQIGDGLDSTQSLIALMWQSQDLERKVESTVTMWLSIEIAVGSALLGASLGGFTSYWYSRDNPSIFIMLSYVVVAIMASWILVWLGPRRLGQLRTRLEEDAAREFLKAAKEQNLIEPVIKGAVKKVLESSSVAPPEDKDHQ